MPQNSITKMNVDISSLLWSILIFIPIVITPYPPWDMYVLPKAVFLWAVFPVLIYYCFKTKNLWIDAYSKTIMIFFALNLLATIFSIDIKHSILGTPSWYEGCILIFIYCGIFILSKKFLILEPKKIKGFLTVGLILAAYSIFQLHKIDPLNDGHSYPPGTTLTTFGNRNSYGIYALLISCFFTSLYVFKGGKKYYLYSCLAYAGLLASCTRSCWLGYAIACAFLLAFTFKQKALRNRCFKFLVAIFVIFGALNFSSSGTLVGRVNTTLGNLQEERSKLGSHRYAIWNESSKALSKRWLLGFGPDSLELGLKKYNDEGLRLIERQTKMGINRAHNEYLQIACNAGILSLIVYLLLLIKAYQNLWKHRNNLYYQCFFITLTAYLLQAIFNNSNIGVAPIYWVLLGLCCRDSKVHGELSKLA